MSKRNHIEHEELRLLHQIASQVAEIKRILTQPSAVTIIQSETGVINMPQSTLTSIPGSDVLTFQTLDSNSVDVTSRCTYAVSSDSASVVFGAVSANTVPATYTPGTANLVIVTTDSSGDLIPKVSLVATISALSAATTVSAQNPATKIA